jgi:hypothetical protein
VPTEFADHQRREMLTAIHEREGRWDEVDPDTEVARIGDGIGLSEDRSYELFGHLVDEGFVDPGRAYGSGGAMPGSISRIVGREENMTIIGDDVGLTRPHLISVCAQSPRNPNLASKGRSVGNAPALSSLYNVPLQNAAYLVANGACTLLG